MSPQVIHSLKQAGIMMILAVLAVVVEHYTGILRQAGISELYLPIIGAALASAVRWAEGKRDSMRAAEGKVVPSDVGYNEISVSDSHKFGDVKYIKDVPQSFIDDYY